jgi:CDP-diglyceride synthetase
MGNNGQNKKRPAASGQLRKGIHVERLAVWLVCSVLLALFPPLLEGVKATWLTDRVVESNASVAAMTAFLQAASSNGEVLLIAGAIAAAMVGEMYGVEYPSLRVFRTLVGVISLFLFAACLYFFPLAKQIVAKSPWFSASLLVASVLVAACGILVSSIDRESHV